MGHHLDAKEGEFVCARGSVIVVLVLMCLYVPSAFSAVQRLFFYRSVRPTDSQMSPTHFNDAHV